MRNAVQLVNTAVRVIKAEGMTEAQIIPELKALTAPSGQVPCYAIPGKRTPFRWVSVGSSACIGRGRAAQWLKWCSADIDQVEVVS